MQFRMEKNGFLDVEDFYFDPARAAKNVTYLLWKIRTKTVLAGHGKISQKLVS